MKNPVIRITKGLHAGSLIVLNDKQKWIFGTSDHVDVLLADDDVATEHFSIARNARGAWLLECMEAMEICDLPIQRGTVLRLGAGMTMRAGGAFMLLACANDETADAPEYEPETAEVSAWSRYRILWQLDRKACLAQLARQERHRVAVVFAMLICLSVVSLIAHHGLARKQATDHRQQLVRYILDLFPHAKVSRDEAAGVVSYGGYVASRQELDRLRALASMADPGRVLVEVVPMDALVFNASNFLDEYYKDISIQGGEAGEINVSVPGQGSMRTLASWDMQGVARKLMATLPDVRSVNVSLAAESPSVITMPWLPGMVSVLRTPGGSYFAVDNEGSRLFDGAMIEHSSVRSMGSCHVELESESGAARYRMVERKGSRCENESTRVDVEN
ncbi:hypothetical protein [Dyella sp.]|uniref:hypothetical protein n=1 Tax=Dyella sp. TaxID=1869338 RepID=UPI002ED2E716